MIEKLLEADWEDHQGNRRLSTAHTFQVKQETAVFLLSLG